MQASEKPRIAVLLAAYRGMRWIEKQIDSILCQEQVELHLYISVDFSDDGTEEWVRQKASSTANITLLPTGERFGSAGLNFYRLLRDVPLENYHATALADQDDIWFPDKLIRGWETIVNGYDAYSSNVIAFWPDGKKKTLDKAQPQTEYDHFFEAAGPGCTYIMSCRVASSLQRFLYLEKDKVNSVFLHDWFIYAFCRNEGYQWYIDSNAGLYYRQHESNQIGANVNVAAYRKRVAMIRSGWYRDQIISLARILKPEMISKFNSRFFLVFNILKLRRHYRDRFYFLVMIVLGFY